jgi:hypothetical protein
MARKQPMYPARGAFCDAVLRRKGLLRIGQPCPSCEYLLCCLIGCGEHFRRNPSPCHIYPLFLIVDSNHKPSVSELAPSSLLDLFMRELLTRHFLELRAAFPGA